MLKVICKKNYHSHSPITGNCDFTKGNVYEIESMYKNPGHELMINFKADDHGDLTQFSLSKVEEFFDLPAGARASHKPKCHCNCHKGAN